MLLAHPRNQLVLATSKDEWHLSAVLGLAEKVTPAVANSFSFSDRKQLRLCSQYIIFCSLFFKKEMELSLIGLQNAGKTSLVNVIATGGFQEDMIPTVGFNMRKVSKGSVTIKLWDLGGQVCSMLEALSTLANCSVCSLHSQNSCQGCRLVTVYQLKSKDFEVL